MNATILWIIAVVLVVVGIVQLIQGQLLFGILLIVAGCLVGPGGVLDLQPSGLTVNGLRQQPTASTGRAPARGR